MNGSEKLFDIIHEDPDLLVVNKPGGLVCHPTKGDAYSSLIGRLRLYYAGQEQITPSFVNRLDRETSGVVLIAKNPAAHARLQRSFDTRSVKKVYYAIVQGKPQQTEGIIDAPLGRQPGSEVIIKQAVIEGGSPSQTKWRLLVSTGAFSLLEVMPLSGRLHQIRVHLASISLPIVGDKIYGPNPRFYLDFIESGWTETLAQQLLTERQMLHAFSLTFENQNWKAPLPTDMQLFMDQNLLGTAENA